MFYIHCVWWLCDQQPIASKKGSNFCWPKIFLKVSGCSKKFFLFLNSRGVVQGHGFLHLLRQIVCWYSGGAAGVRALCFQTCTYRTWYRIFILLTVIDFRICFESCLLAFKELLLMLVVIEVDETIQTTFQLHMFATRIQKKLNNFAHHQPLQRKNMRQQHPLYLLDASCS